MELYLGKHYKLSSEDDARVILLEISDDKKRVRVAGVGERKSFWVKTELLTNTKTNEDIYVYRLAKEWEQHGKIILAIDFDNTVYPYNTLDNKEDMDRAIKLIKEAHQVGTYNVIFTASNKERHPEILEHCKEIGIHVDSINTNPIAMPYGNEGKIYYNINICDRSGMREALNTLEAAMYRQRAHLNAERHAGQDEIG